MSLGTCLVIDAGWRWLRRCCCDSDSPETADATEDEHGNAAVGDDDEWGQEAVTSLSFLVMNLNRFRLNDKPRKPWKPCEPCRPINATCITLNPKR